MHWNPQQEQTMHGERQYNSYSGYSGTPEQLHYTNEREQPEQQTGFYQPGENMQYVVYHQPQPYATGEALNLGSVAAILSYTMGWFTGLLFFLFAGQNRYVRFHALQSLIFFGAINVLDIALINLAFFGRFHLYGMHYVSIYAFFALVFLNIVAFFGWLVAMIQAARGKYYKLPLVGGFVERWLNRDVILK